jgi:hypothetical protein
MQYTSCLIYDYIDLATHIWFIFYLIVGNAFFSFMAAENMEKWLYKR